LARRPGVTPRTVHNWIRKGGIVERSALAPRVAVRARPVDERPA